MKTTFLLFITTFFVGSAWLLPDKLTAKTSSKPLIIAHRGASGYLPEHTLAAYQKAMEMGADFIEPDLVSTQDGVLVARHEPNLIDTTDVLQHPEFASRRTKKWIDQEQMDGFFVEDFTWAELKTLRAIQPRAYRDQSFNGQFAIPSFAEIIALVQSFERQTGRRVGIYPEIKHPSYFRQLGLSLEEPLLEALSSNNFTDPTRLYIQSFEVTALKDILRPLLQQKGLSIPLIQLFDELHLIPADYVLSGRQETYGDLLTKSSLQTFVRSYAQGLGLWKASIIKRAPLPQAKDLNGDGLAECTETLTGEVLPAIENAHAADLLVHVYTMRDEERFLADGYASPAEEYQTLTALGVDGFFTDFPDTAIKATTLP